MGTGRGPGEKPSFSAEVATELAGLKQRLRAAAQQPGQLVQLVREVERRQGCALLSDPRALCEMYHLAMRAFGPRPLIDAPEEYAELCAKRLSALRSVDPEEARLFADFMAHHSIRETVTSAELPAPAAVPASAAAGVGATRRPASEASATVVPVRPRSLRYSSCDEPSAVLDSEVPLAAQGAAAAPPPVAPAPAPRPPDRAAAAAVPASPRQASSQPIGAAENSDFSDLSSDGEVTANSWSRRQAKVIVVNGLPYEVVNQVGRGATCKVFEVCRADHAGRGLPHFALKRMRAEKEADLKIFAEEVNLLMHLKDCPQVVKAIDAEVLWDRKVIHIVMELGRMDLGRLLDGQRLGLGDLQVLWRQMLEAVQAIHELRVIHGDLKPGNFLLADGRLKLIDFGISKRIAGETTNVHRDGGALGTISYIAPEVIRKSAGIPSIKTGRASDVWSLGIILYQLVYGQTPFHDLPPAQRIATIANPELSIHFPAHHCLENHSEATKTNLLHVLGRCLDTDPANRASIAELLEDPFLQGSVREVSRSSFDRAMQVLVEGFHEAARQAALLAGTAAPCGGAEADEDEDEPHHACWRALSDVLWSRLAPCEGLASAVPAVCGGATAELPQLDLRSFRDCLQRWVQHGAKRLRTDEAPAAAAPASSSRAAAPPALAAPRPAAPAPMASAPAAATAVAGARGGGLFPASVRQLGGGGGGGSAPGLSAGGPRPRIDAGMLQQQRGCLKRGAIPGSAPPPQQENILLQRLRERRAIVKPASHVVEETTNLTGITPWTSGGG